MTRMEYELNVANEQMAPAKISVERWAPGDGRARYRLVVNGHDCGPYLMGRSAMLDALSMLNAALYQAGISGQ